MSDPEPLRSLGAVAFRTLFGMILLVVLNQWLMSWRFRIVMHFCAGAELSHWQWFRLTTSGQFLNLFVPQLGHLHRALVLKRDLGVPFTAYVTGMSIFFWFELLTSFLLAAIVVAVVEPGFCVGTFPVIVILGACLGVLLLGPVLLATVVGRLRIGSVRIRGALERLRALGESLVALRQRWFFVRFLGINVLVAFTHVAMLWLAFDAVGGGLGWGNLMLFQVLLKLTNQIALTPGNLGVTELAYGVLADATSSGVEQGIAAAVLVRAVGTLVMVVLGCAAGGLSLLLSRRRESTRANDTRDGMS